MALYMVKARPRKELLANLQKDLSSGKISKMRPFGHALQYSLENARFDNENPDYALWVEEDYCSHHWLWKEKVYGEAIDIVSNANHSLQHQSFK
jgi:hypothetical protein